MCTANLERLIRTNKAMNDSTVSDAIWQIYQSWCFSFFLFFLLSYMQNMLDFHICSQWQTNWNFKLPLHPISMLWSGCWNKKIKKEGHYHFHFLHCDKTSVQYLFTIAYIYQFICKPLCTLLNMNMLQLMQWTRIIWEEVSLFGKFRL